MSEPTTSESVPISRSRRAVLAGALGGIGALAATAIGGASRAQAAAGDPLIIGSQSNNAGSADTQLLTNSSVVAFKLLQNGPGTALMGYATPTTGATRGVYGRTDSPDGDGVQARNSGALGGGAAMRAFGGNNFGIRATSDIVAAVYGASSSGEGVLGTSTSDVGVLGISTSDIGVQGASGSSYGVYGYSTSNYAGYFAGHIRVAQYVDIPEMTVPLSPAANSARLFVRDIGGKSQVCAKFSDGSIVVMAAQP